MSTKLSKAFCNNIKNRKSAHRLLAVAHNYNHKMLLLSLLLDLVLEWADSDKLPTLIAIKSLWREWVALVQRTFRWWAQLARKEESSERLMSSRSCKVLAPQWTTSSSKTQIKAISKKKLWNSNFFFICRTALQYSCSNFSKASSRTSRMRTRKMKTS